MPTYTVWSATGLIAPAARAQIAQTARGQRAAATLTAQITEIHHDVARAPRYFVQVVYTELQPDSHFVAGQPASPKHVWVRVDLRSGRTADQKRRLLERLTTEVGAIVGADAEEVWMRLGRAKCVLTTRQVYLNDIDGPNIAEYGRPLPAPGQEDAWFAALPETLRKRLEPLK